MIVFEISAIIIICTLLVIMTNTRQNKADHNNEHGYIHNTRALMIVAHFSCLLCAIAAIPANRFGIGLIHNS